MQALGPMNGGGAADHQYDLPNLELLEMDPLSALGVASNILAVIDFGWTLLTEARTIHKSSSGLSGEAEFVNQLIRDVAILDERLPSQIHVDGELRNLLAESKNITGLLQKALQSVKTQGPRSKWGSFLSALNQTWGKEHVKDLTAKLASLQTQVTRHLHLATHSELTHGMAAVSRAIADIKSTNIRLEMERREDFQQLQSKLIQAIEESAIAGKDIATHTDNLVDEKVQVEIERPQVLANLVDFRKLQDITRVISETAEITRADQRILDRLYFNQIQARHHKIEIAHAQTFQWAFEDSLPHQQDTKPRLREWLESRGGVFWVYGKPGSGKSTFMKFLCSSSDTPCYLRNWAGRKKLIMAKFFFWNAGTALQKSQEGLLRSLLFEILRQCPELMSTVKSAAREIPDWDDLDALRYTPNLLLLYKRVLGQDIPIKFCFFVDGMDEFQENGRDHLDLVRFLRQLQLSPDFKLCVSSRPWTVFGDEFGLNPEWTLKLEDLTRNDIRRYVSDKFDEHPQFKKLTLINENYSHIVDAVVNRAQGVFLWIYLVVRTLLEGLTFHDSVKTLYQRLHEFPPDLESFFQHLIDSVKPIYRTQMARYFKIATLADEPLPAMVYYYLDDIDDNPDFAIVLAQSEPVLDHTRLRRDQLRRDQLRRRLDGRSRGLLEIVKWEDHWSYIGTDSHLTALFTYKVDFLHRTVRDFLRQSADVASSLQHVPGSENFPFTACHAILAEMKTAQFISECGQRTLMLLVQELFLFVSASLAENPGSEAALCPILEAAEPCYRSASRKGNILEFQPFLFIGLAAQIDVFTYVRAKLVAKPNMLQEARSDPGVRPALDFALQPECYPYPISARSVTHLLEAGADPNETFTDHTVWARFLIESYRGGIRDREKTCELIRVLLFHGADLNAESSLPQDDSVPAKVPLNKSIKAKALVDELLTPDVANSLYQEMRQERNEKEDGITS
ncbi:actin [Apiospora arundinis]